MYTALAKHSGMSLTMKCKGDLWIDDHHTADESDVVVSLYAAYLTFWVYTGQCYRAWYGLQASIR
jgi:imidazoleglycerol phosphate dehydratase HisB